MSRPRTVHPYMMAPTHSGEKKCITMTESAIATIDLGEDGHFAAITLSLPDLPIGAIAILDRDEVEAHIQFLRNAIEDAELLDAGKAPVHAAESLRRS